jgi:hypothetical protein
MCFNPAMEDPVYRSLELAAESVGDLTPLVYEKYFNRCVGSAALMSHIDDIVRGRMLQEVMRLVMLADYSDEQQYLDFEVRNHRTAYSVEPHMYGNLLSALRDTVREAVDGNWNDSFESTWNDRIAALLSEIGARHEESGDNPQQRPRAYQPR